MEETLKTDTEDSIIEPDATAKPDNTAAEPDNAVQHDTDRLSAETHEDAYKPMIAMRSQAVPDFIADYLLKNIEKEDKEDSSMNELDDSSYFDDNNDNILTHDDEDASAESKHTAYDNDGINSADEMPFDEDEASDAAHSDEYPFDNNESLKTNQPEPSAKQSAKPSEKRSHMPKHHDYRDYADEDDYAKTLYDILIEYAVKFKACNDNRYIGVKAAEYFDNLIRCIGALNTWNDVMVFSSIRDVCSPETAMSLDDGLQEEFDALFNDMLAHMTSTQMMKECRDIRDSKSMPLMEYAVYLDDNSRIDKLTGTAADFFKELSDYLMNVSYRMESYPDYAYHRGDNERPHIAPYENDWADTQYIGPMPMHIAMSDVALNRTVEKDGKEYLSPKTRAELSCPWCAWMDDLDYAQSVFYLYSTMLSDSNLRRELVHLKPEIVETLDKKVAECWKWFAKHIVDIQQSD